MKVVNRGFNQEKGEWSEYTGTAKFRGDSNVGALSVRFFPGMNAGYNILSVDGDYEYALVAGRNLDFLWLLSRTPTMPNDIREKYLNMATAVGYDVARLHWVNQQKNAN